MAETVQNPTTQERKQTSTYFENPEAKSVLIRADQITIENERQRNSPSVKNLDSTLTQSQRLSADDVGIVTKASMNSGISPAICHTIHWVAF